ncbi:uncharacterized protein LOC110610029 isoform X2 [Manihot esculenta]|uniref:uncharacterized protein LOC110610029 isoform X2 n=1 Tax=Manihot esculenta TaxID=3983 RepID=UPI000B5D0E01|nr:uncharacterized protein LOC110610029 isoform X2 [Manihot esculenta]
MEIGKSLLNLLSYGKSINTELQILSLYICLIPASEFSPDSEIHPRGHIYHETYGCQMNINRTKQNQKCGRDVITFVLKGQWKRNDAIGRSQSVPSKREESGHI